MSEDLDPAQESPQEADPCPEFIQTEKENEWGVDG